MVCYAQRVPTVRGPLCWFSYMCLPRLPSHTAELRSPAKLRELPCGLVAGKLAAVHMLTVPLPYGICCQEPSPTTVCSTVPSSFVRVDSHDSKYCSRYSICQSTLARTCTVLMWPRLPCAQHGFNVYKGAACRLRHKTQLQSARLEVQRSPQPMSSVSTPPTQ